MLTRRGDTSSSIIQVPATNNSYVSQQEFGTFKPTEVLKASRAENRWTQWGQYVDQVDARRHWSRENMLRAFNPKDEIWQAKITSRGRAVFNKAREDLLG